MWHERKILPESIVRHHIRELESTSEVSFSSVSSRFPPRAERALNDPIREMEGMLVDEYGRLANFSTSSCEIWHFSITSANISIIWCQQC